MNIAILCMLNALSGCDWTTLDGKTFPEENEEGNEGDYCNGKFINLSALIQPVDPSLKIQLFYYLLSKLQQNPRKSNLQCYEIIRFRLRNDQFRNAYVN